MNEALERLLEAEVRQEGFRLYQWTLRPGGKRRVLQIFLYAEGGVKLDDCARVSRRLGEAVEAADLVQGAYVLEVSSPGLDRPLQKDWHFADAVGEKISLQVRSEEGESRSLEGVLLGLENGSLRLDCGGSEEMLFLDSVHRARVVPEIVMRRKKAQVATEECDE